MSQLAAVILAAGQSTRMKSKKSKVLHDLAGRPVISYPIVAAKDAGAAKIVVVRGQEQDDLKEYLDAADVTQVVQKKPLGTANAVASAGGMLKSFSGNVLILCGDVPLVRGWTLKKFVEEAALRKSRVAVLTMTLRDPTGYGRIVRDLDGRMVRIVEEKDAAEKERKICEVNSGIICADREWLFKTLKNIGSENAKGEFYLTDLVRMSLKEGSAPFGLLASPPEDFLGINTRVELARATRIMRERINRAHMLNGVGIQDDLHTVIDADVTIGEDTSISPFTFLLGKTRIGRDCIIENGVVIRDTVIGDGVRIKPYSVIEEGVAAAGAIIGPFSRLRPASKVGKGARVGNFVELKKCELKDGAKVNHLTYLGDATVGAHANIGCGTITCNYDGSAKHKTVIGSHSFVGSDVQFVAPVRIGSGSVIGAGSTITKDVPSNALSLSRAEQVIVKGWANKNQTRNSKSEIRNKKQTRNSSAEGRIRLWRKTRNVENEI